MIIRIKEIRYLQSINGRMRVKRNWEKSQIIWEGENKHLVYKTATQSGKVWTFMMAFSNWQMVRNRVVFCFQN